MSDPNANRAGYKETKVGWIPEEWRVVATKDVGKTVTGSTPATNNPDYYGGSYLFASPSDLGGSRYINATKTTLSRIGAAECRIVPANSVLFVCIGSTIGKVGMAGVDLATNQQINTVIVEEDYDATFVFYGLHAHSPKIASLAARQAVPIINKTEFGCFKWACPPLAEQEKIAEILSFCDEAIEKAGALIDAKKRQKKALMQQLLTGKKRLPGFEGDWVHRKMSSVLSHVFRPVEWAGDKIFNLVSVRRRSMGLFRREPLRGDQYKTKDLHTLKSGDFLISKRQVTHGALAMITDEFDGCHVSKEYSIFINKDPTQLHMPFFNWLSRTRRMWWLAYVASNGVVIEKLIFVPQDFLKFEILLPPTAEEQAAISNILDGCDVELAALERKMAAFGKQKKALMQKLLTGQIRVKL